MDKIIISSDSHVFEPTDLWIKTLGSRFGEKVPHGVKSFEGHEGNFFYVGRAGEAVEAVGDRQPAVAPERPRRDLHHPRG